MSDKVLCVDDEFIILAAYRRQLRKCCDVETAQGGEEGLAAIAARGPFAVIVADMNMPGMDGIEFLRRVREVAPDSVRMMLTGDADHRTAINAVNEGNIFRFLTKPCPSDVLARAISAGAEQYRLVTAEKELLEQTLRGSIAVLTEVLSLVNPVAFGRASRLQRLVRKLAAALEVKDTWRLEVAAMLSQVGCVTVPEPVLDKVYGGANLAAPELLMYQRHPEVGSGLIAKIPRLQAVAEMVAYQEKHFDGQGLPRDGKQGPDIPLGGRVLKAVLDFDGFELRGHTKLKVIECLRERTGWYDPLILDALERVAREETPYASRQVTLGELRPGMILREAVLDRNGIMLVGKGQEITETLLDRLQNLAQHRPIQQPIAVLAATDL
ncbi:MAG TPA: HD domain-containing phosphohydrolase [Gemmataceae bacterium]|nr:HD domain-containing phosphohydrolase [Gemmataceae bacterium]